MTQTIALCKHYFMAYTWRILPKKAKIALWERHTRNKLSINERLKRN